MSIENFQRGQVDRDILYYIREAQSLAPVREGAVEGFLRDARRRRVTTAQVQDRLDYLTSAGYLEERREWDDGGEVSDYRITATGMDLLDGAIPPRNWKGR